MACVLVHIEADDHPTPASLAALGEGRRVASSSGATLYAAIVVSGDTNLIESTRDELVVELGRHDPCVLPRAVPIVEAMFALVLADFLLIQRAVRPFD